MLEIGDSLREARSRRGFDLDQVEAGTMIRARYLEALELEQFEVLPAGAYRRSFLREYAQFLGLDGDILVDEYVHRFEPPEPEPEPPPRRRVPDWFDDLRLRRGLVVVVALALFGIAVWQLGSTGSSRPRPAAAVTARTHRAAPAPTPPRATHQSARGAPPVLALTAAHGNCWLLVRIGSSAGPSVYEATLQQGQTARFGLRKPLWIRLGAPWNVKATIGRRAVDGSLPALTGDTMATASGLTPAP